MACIGWCINCCREGAHFRQEGGSAPTRMQGGPNVVRFPFELVRSLGILFLGVSVTDSQVVPSVPGCLFLQISVPMSKPHLTLMSKMGAPQSQSAFHPKEAAPWKPEGKRRPAPY